MVVVIVVVSRIGKLRGWGEGGRDENGKSALDAVAWYRSRRRPFRLFIIYIDMFSSGEGAIQRRAPRHPDGSVCDP